MWKHASRVGDYLPLLPLLGKSLESVVQRFGVSECLPLRLYLRALCQITVQCPPEQRRRWNGDIAMHHSGIRLKVF